MTYTSIIAKLSSSMDQWPIAGAPTSGRNICTGWPSIPSKEARREGDEAKATGKSRAMVEMAR